MVIVFFIIYQDYFVGPAFLLGAANFKSEKLELDVAMKKKR